MTAVFVKSASFLFVILLGVAFRAAGIFGEKDHRVISNIVLKITLPAAVISSTANTNTGEAKPSLVSAICSKIHSSAAHSKITPVISKSRQEKENQVDNLNFVFLVCTCKGPPADKTVLYSLL